MVPEHIRTQYLGLLQSLVHHKESTIEKYFDDGEYDLTDFDSNDSCHDETRLEGYYACKKAVTPINRAIADLESSFFLLTNDYLWCQ